jgi:hypothetical protein
MEDVEVEIDKREILAEIGANAPVPFRDLVVPDLPIASLNPPAAVPLGRAKNRLVRHRHQIAALILIFVGFIWISVGLAAIEASAIAIGAASLLMAILVGLDAVLR